MFSPGIDKEERIVHLPLCVQIQCDWVLRLSTSGKGCYISAKFDANKLQKLYLARSSTFTFSCTSCLGQNNVCPKNFDVKTNAFFLNICKESPLFQFC